MSMYAGSNMTRLTTWWKLADAWVSYVNRSQALLQRGRYRATVLWLSGESLPNGAWYAVRDEITNAGYDYDYCSADDIADSLKFEDGEIFASADGTRYKMLALGADRRLSLRTLKAVEKLLEAGANVVGTPPIESPTLSDNPEEFAETVKRLWGGGEKVRKIGKGTLYAMRSVPDALSLARIAPEFKTPRGIRTIGRIDGDTDIRFVANMTQTRIAGDVSFNAGEGKSPYIFDAVDGGVSPVPQWKCENGIVLHSPFAQPLRIEIRRLQKRRKQADCRVCSVCKRREKNGRGRNSRSRLPLERFARKTRCEGFCKRRLRRKSAEPNV